MKRLLVLGLVASLAVVVSASPQAPAVAAACPLGATTWVGGDGDFSEPANWLPPVVPSAGVDACIDLPVTVTVDVAATVDEFVSNGVLVIPTASGLSINGASNLSSVLLDGAVSVSAATTYAVFTEIGGGAQLDAASGAVLTVYGNADLTGGTISVTGLGDVDLSGRLVASAPTTISSPDGAFAVGQCDRQCSGGLLDGSTHGIDLTGTHTWHTNSESLGVVTNHAMLTVSAEDQSGSTDYGTIGGDFTNYGTMVWEPYTPFGDGDVASVFTNEGLLVVSGRMGFVGFTAPSTFVNNGTINVLSGGSMSTTGAVWDNTGDIVVEDGGRFRLYELFGGDTGFTNSGTIDLGAHPPFTPPYDTSFSVEGDFENTSTGAITVGVSGSEASQLYPKMSVDGTATLDGSLVVERRSNFDPVVGETYPIISYASAAGSFASGPGPFFSAAVGATETTVTRVLTDPTEAVSEDALAGETVSTDAGVSPTNPLATSVVTPNAGLVSIVEESPVPVTAPPGYEIVGTQFSNITAPDATVGDPLIITFTIDVSQWNTYPLSTLSVMRNGVLVPDCDVPGDTGSAMADPCVGSRTGTEWSTPAQIVVRTSQASDWVIVAEELPPDSDGDGVLDTNDVCPNTSALGTATTLRLKKNRFAVDSAGDFLDGRGTFSGFTIFDTAGCDEHQIIDHAGLGKGHTNYGLSRSAMENWVTAVSR